MRRRSLRTLALGLWVVCATLSFVTAARACWPQCPGVMSTCPCAFPEDWGITYTGYQCCYDGCSNPNCGTAVWKVVHAASCSGIHVDCSVTFYDWSNTGAQCDCPEQGCP